MSKKLLLIATGGTIASRPAEDGLTPEMTSEELLQCIPEVRSLCEIDTVQPFNLDSTNMRPQNWVELVKIIRDKYESYDGFVITHGTDTMAYAAATLYYLIQNSPKPVVLTGSQVSIYLEHRLPGGRCHPRRRGALLYPRVVPRPGAVL